MCFALLIYLLVVYFAYLLHAIHLTTFFALIPAVPELKLAFSFDAAQSKRLT